MSYLIFPRRCFFCGAVVAPSVEVCVKCAASVERVGAPVCPGCGCEKKRCGCKGHRRFFSAVAAPFYYTGAARDCLVRFKFSGKRELAKGLGGEMVKAAENILGSKHYDLVTCVPMRRINERSRGYNQSALLCAEVAKRLNIEHDSALIVKLYDTPSQHDLPVYLRSGNVFGVFDVARPDKVKDKTVLLCDDIKTSGETLNECAKMLRLSGARDVVCLCAAVVPGRKEKTCQTFTNVLQ